VRRSLILLGLLPLALGACVYDRTGRSGTSMLVRDVQANQVAAERALDGVDGERARVDVIEERASLARRNMAKSTATAENLVESLQALAGELQNIRHLLEKGQAIDADLDYRLADIAFRLMTVEEKLGIEPEIFVPEDEEGAAGEDGEEGEEGADEGAGGDAAAEGDPRADTAADVAAADAVASAVAIPVDEELDIALAEGLPDENTDPDLNLLARALQAMQVDNYAQAGRALTEFLDTYPRSERAADARILLGDCLFELGRYNEAISEYESFIQIAPDHARVPSAMLSQGLAFIELGTESDLQAARVFLDDLIEIYPRSPEADRARRKIQSLE